jgi:P4 family phage/plasmid primase-like protien
METRKPGSGGNQSQAKDMEADGSASHGNSSTAIRPGQQQRPVTGMPIDHILPLLHDVKHNTGESGWAALCPAHDDHKRSLSVDVGDDGTVLVHCHAGCEFESIAQALGLQKREFFPPRSFKDPIATYTYVDSEGRPRYQVLRYAPKQFKQRRLNGSGKWEWKGPRNPDKVLYRLPEIEAADAHNWIFVCEGEKSCDRVAALGLASTTNVGGAGKWGHGGNNYTVPLAGRRVAIVPDNDQPGKGHAEDVARSLHGIAASVRIVSLPGLEYKEDVVDWLSRGGSPEELLELVDAAPEWDPPASTGASTDSDAGPTSPNPDQSPTVADLDSLFNRLLNAPANRRRQSLLDLAAELAQADPLTVDLYAEKVKAANVGVTKQAFAGTVRGMQSQKKDDNRDHSLDSGRPTDDELRDRWLAIYPDTAHGLGDWRRYEGGIWHTIPAEQVQGEIGEVLEDAKSEGVRPSAAKLRSVYDLARVKPAVFVPAEHWDADPDILVCRNGTLHIPSLTLRPHRRDDYVTAGVPYAYDPEAKAIMFLWAIRSQIPEAEQFLQEFAGYCLTIDTSHEIALWAYGPPGSGKSTLFAGLQAMLGSRAGLLGLADIERSRFGLTSVIGKTLVVSTEQPGSFIASSHILNALISGEPITVDRKFRDAIEIKPYAKIAWAMNSLPRVDGPENGLFRRVKIVRFPPLPRAERDSRVKEAIKEEGPGILNWALEGLLRLRDRGSFEIPSCIKDSSAEFEHSHDKAALFVEECCVTGPDRKIQSSALYEKYKWWCEDNGFRPESSVKMAEHWQRLGFENYMSNGRVFWRGVGLGVSE